MLVLFIFSVASAITATPQNVNSTDNDFTNAHGLTPYILWQWMNGCVTKEGITFDLQEFKKLGIKNVQQFLVGGQVADTNAPSVSVLGDKRPVMNLFLKNVVADTILDRKDIHENVLNFIME